MRWLRIHSFVLLATALASAEIETFEIYHTNDLHGSLEGIEDDLPLPFVFGGATRLVTALSELTHDKKNVLWVDAGDFNGSNAFSLEEHGHGSWRHMSEFAKLIPELRPLVTLGNHDMEGGVIRLTEYLSENHDLGFDVLAANLFEPPCKSLPKKDIGSQGTPEIAISDLWKLLGAVEQQKKYSPQSYQALPDFRTDQDIDFLCEKFDQFRSLSSLVKPYQIVERSGFRIGLVGYTIHTVEYEGSYWPFRRTSPLSSAQALIDSLYAQKVDAVGIISHQGLKRDIELAKRTYGINFIVGGHDHKLLPSGLWVENEGHPNRPKRKTLIVQLGRGGAYLGRISLSQRTEPIEKYEVFPLDSRWIPNHRGKKALAIVEQAQRNVESLLPGAHQQLGEAKMSMPWLRNRECLVNDFVADAFVDYGRSLGQEEVFSLGFQEFNEKNLLKGPVTFRDAFNLVPRVDFVTGEPSEVWLVHLDGRNLSNLLQIAQLSQKWFDVGGGQLIAKPPTKDKLLPLEALQLSSRDPTTGFLSFRNIRENGSYIWVTFSLVARMLPIITERIRQISGVDFIRPLRIDKTGISVTDMVKSYVLKSSPLSPEKIFQGRVRFKDVAATVLLETLQPSDSRLAVTVANLGEKRSTGCRLEVFGIDNPEAPLHRRYSSSPLATKSDLTLEGDPGLSRDPSLFTQVEFFSLPVSPISQVEIRLSCPPQDFPSQKSETYPHYKTLRIDRAH